jgi:hypothetical protein
MNSEEEKNKTEKPVLPEIEDIQSDWFLERIVKTIDGTDDEIGITLNIGGILLSGLIISVHKYFQWFADSMGIDDADRERLREYYKVYGDVYLKEKEANAKPPVFIHMKDAKFYQPGGNNSIPTVEGSYWRGRITTVDGFILGKLTTEKKSE